MTILKQLIDTAPLSEAIKISDLKKAAKRAKGKAHDGKHDDGTKLQFDKNGPFKGQKFSQFVGANMVMPEPDNGDMAGTMEATDPLADMPDVKKKASKEMDIQRKKIVKSIDNEYGSGKHDPNTVITDDGKEMYEGRTHRKSPEDTAHSKLLNATLMTKKGATHRDKKNDYKREKLNLKKVMNEGMPQRRFKFCAYTEIYNAEGQKIDQQEKTGTVIAPNKDEARQKVLNDNKKAYRVTVTPINEGAPVIGKLAGIKRHD